MRQRVTLEDSFHLLRIRIVRFTEDDDSTGLKFRIDISSRPTGHRSEMEGSMKRIRFIRYEKEE